MKLDSGTASLMVLAGAQGLTIFTTLMPDRSEVRNADPDDANMCGDIRHGEIMSSFLTLGFATLLAWLVGDELPIWIGAACCITMITAYEVTLQRKVC